MTEPFKKGDLQSISLRVHVEWNSSGNKITGKVEKKLTQPTEIKGHHVAASDDNPQYLVRSDKTGQEAAHKAESLKKLED